MKNFSCANVSKSSISKNYLVGRAFIIVCIDVVSSTCGMRKLLYRECPCELAICLFIFLLRWYVETSNLLLDGRNWKEYHINSFNLFVYAGKEWNYEGTFWWFFVYEKNFHYSFFSLLKYLQHFSIAGAVCISSVTTTSMLVMEMRLVRSTLGVGPTPVAVAREWIADGSF